jgi:hypothetical protein
MSLFNLFSKKSTNPYKNGALNKIYSLLFCDNIELYKADTNTTEYPWNILFLEPANLGKLVEIAENKSLESRQRIIAYNLLLANKSPVTSKELLGIIVEVALASGLDTLAAFSDGTARYINHSEKLIVWEARTAESDKLINQLFSDSANVISKIGPWDKERKPFPTKGTARMTFLVSDGLYFGEAPFAVLQNDEMGRSVINSAFDLLCFLTSQEQ